MTMITVFLDPSAPARGGALGSVDPLYVYADGRHSTSVTFQFPREATPDVRVRVAEAMLRGVQQWRDSVVASAEGERTTADELAEARAEIARLKAEGGAL